MDVPVLPDQQNLHQFCMDTACYLDDQSGMLANKNGWRERESQGTQCFRQDLLMIYIYIYIYIYICIVIHRQTVSFYQNSSVWLDRLDSRSWDRNLAD